MRKKVLSVLALSMCFCMGVSAFAGCGGGKGGNGGGNGGDNSSTQQSGSDEGGSGGGTTLTQEQIYAKILEAVDATAAYDGAWTSTYYDKYTRTMSTGDVEQVEMDEVIVQEQSMPITEIFEKYVTFLKFLRHISKTPVSYLRLFSLSR